jgi:GTPase SAR1 family protein
MSDDEGDVEFDDKTTDFNYKLIIVGESGVGKTSMITRYVDDRFSEEHDITVNVAFFEKIFDIPETRKKAKLHVWDTLGQEKFTNLA